jgi:4-alpha-glucanotransferase
VAVAFIFGVHNHQPLGNFDGVLEEAARRSYRPFFQALRRFPEVRVLVHTSGLLLEWWETHAPDLLDLVAELAGRGQVEPLTGGLTEPILPLLPDHDKVGQIRALTERVTKRLGVRPRGMWLAERVWEPHLARPLVEAGVEYVLVDDHHFAMAGLDPDRLSGYYLTEEQGHTLAVFPISQRLRYLIPFGPVEEVFGILTQAVARGGALTMVDDGEKFGVWPGTHALVYENGWLERFLGGLPGLPGVELTTASEYLDRYPATGRVYLPTTSYREMTEWVLEPEAAALLERTRTALIEQAGADAGRLLRGGFWRNFLVRYPEVNDTYRKMLRVSGRIQARLDRSPGDRALLAARDTLWRGQCNDAYWHGIFGGVYLPHLRRAVRSAVLAAEAAMDRAEPGMAPVVHESGDLDGDGAAEVAVRSDRLSLLVRPAAGGTLTELAYRPLAFDLADVLTRRVESAHLRLAEAAPGREEGGLTRTIHERWMVKEEGLERLLAYDSHRRASLQDYLLEPAAGAPDLERAWVAFPGRRYAAQVRPLADGVAVELRADAVAQETPVTLAKVLEVRAGADRLAVRYEARAERPLRARLAVRWNLTLTGPAADRYYRDEAGRAFPLDGHGEREVGGVDLVDEWLGLTARLRFDPRGHLAWAPVYTVSLSEEGLERVWQGVEVTVAWLVELGTEPWQGRIDLDLEGRRGSA